jgi:hypothetical protein
MRPIEGDIVQLSLPTLVPCDVWATAGENVSCSEHKQHQRNMMFEHDWLSTLRNYAVAT